MVDVVWLETDKKLAVGPYGKPVYPSGMDDAKWNVMMGQTRNLMSAKPTWTIKKVIETPVHQGDICVLGIFCLVNEPAGANRDILDFIDVAVDDDGFAHVAYTNDLVDTSACICVTNQTSGSTVNGDSTTTKLLAPKAAIGFRTLTPKRGRTMRVRANLRVCNARTRGTTIQLQKKVSGAWRKVAAHKLGATCRTIFKIKANFTKRTFRSFWKKQDPDYHAGHSRSKTVITHP
jgi:hypothetical protein